MVKENSRRLAESVELQQSPDALCCLAGPQHESVRSTRPPTEDLKTHATIK